MLRVATGNEIGADGDLALAGVLAQTQLKQLNLGRTFFVFACERRLADARCGLCMIARPDNDAQDAGACSLAAVLAETQLTQLDISGTRENGKRAKKLALLGQTDPGVGSITLLTIEFICVSANRACRQ